MISDKSLISGVKAATGSVMIANGARIPIEGVGNLKLFEKSSPAFYLPQFTSNLISVKKATVDLDCQVVFRPNEVEFHNLKTGRVIGRGDSKNQLYHLQTAKTSNPIDSVCLSSNADRCESTTWHARLGHPHARAIELIMPNMSFNHLECEACILGKHCRTVFPTSETIYANCFDLVHSDRFWGDAVQTACYLINQIPTKVLKNLSPFEVLNKSKPYIDHLRVFGCLCYVWVPGEQRNKLEAKSTKAMLIGYSVTQKGYKCYDPATRRVLVSRDVKFIETKGYYEEKNWEDLEDLSQEPRNMAENLRNILERLGVNMSQDKVREVERTTPLDHEGGMESESRVQEQHQEDSGHHDQEVTQEVENVPQVGVNEQGEVHDPEEVSETETEVQAEVQAEDQVQVLRRSTRIKRDASNWWDNFFMPTPMRFIQLPGDSPPLYVSKSSFLQGDSSWFDWNDEEAVLFPNWETGIT
ncbi:hypothetical protein Bca101_101276 [Brassica carinata]